MMVFKEQPSWLQVVMMVRGSVARRILGRLLVTTLFAALVTEVYREEIMSASLTMTPFSLIGVALGIFLGFRNNAAYDRWWEARKVIGELNNTATSFTCEISVYFSNPANVETNHQPNCGNIAEDLVGLTRLYVEALKNELLEKD